MILSTIMSVGRSVVRRKNQEFRSAEETRSAIAGGLTLDQFGLNPGDELVIGQQHGVSPASIIAYTDFLSTVTLQAAATAFQLAHLHLKMFLSSSSSVLNLTKQMDC